MRGGRGRSDEAVCSDEEAAPVPSCRSKHAAVLHDQVIITSLLLPSLLAHCSTGQISHLPAVICAPSDPLI